MSAPRTSLKHSARRAANFVDAIGRPCSQCAVAGVADPTGACRYFAPDGPPCVVAKGQYRKSLRAALPVVKDRAYLEPLVDDYAMLRGQIEQLKVERRALLSAGKSVDEIDEKISKLRREASKASREAGLAAHVGANKEPEFDQAVFAS